VLENTVIIDLLVQDGDVVGAVSVNETTDEMTIFIAKSIVLATGGAGRIIKKTDPRIPETITGHGYAMVYRDFLNQKGSSY
jgi:succinate dehydrogenase/fumarate reductase flavoprotein subunit